MDVVYRNPACGASRTASDLIRHVGIAPHPGAVIDEHGRRVRR